MNLKKKTLIGMLAAATILCANAGIVGTQFADHDQLITVSADGTQIPLTDVNLISDKVFDLAPANGLSSNYSGSGSGYLKGYYGVKFNVTTAGKVGVTLTSSSSSMKSLTVIDSDGKVIATQSVLSGSAVINENLNKGTYYALFYINQTSGEYTYGLSLTNSSLKNISDVTFTATWAADHTATLTYYYNGTKLVLGRDYISESLKNYHTTTSDKTIYFCQQKITGIGNYVGSKEFIASYAVSNDSEKTSIADSDTTVDSSLNNNVPVFTIKHNGTTLRANVDYTVKTNIEVSERTDGFINVAFLSTIKGIGNYKDERTYAQRKLAIPATLISNDSKYKTNKISYSFIDKSTGKTAATIQTKDQYVIPPTSLAKGNYSLLISSSNFVSRTYQYTKVSETTHKLQVPAGDDPSTVGKLYLKGDIDGDGRVSNSDIMKIKSHLKKLKALTGYSQRVADVDNTNSVNNSDIMAIKSHLKGIKKMW